MVSDSRQSARRDREVLVTSRKTKEGVVRANPLWVRFFSEFRIYGFRVNMRYSWLFLLVLFPPALASVRQFCHVSKTNYQP